MYFFYDKWDLQIIVDSKVGDIPRCFGYWQMKEIIIALRVYYLGLPSYTELRIRRESEDMITRLGFLIKYSRTWL
jgi:hypothetical protein